MAVLQVNVLGTSFAMKADEDLPYLEKIRDYYSNVCEEIRRKDGIEDQKQIAVLAGILISDELFKEKQKLIRQRDAAQNADTDSRLGEEAERLTRIIIEKIDKALN